MSRRRGFPVRADGFRHHWGDRLSNGTEKVLCVSLTLVREGFAMRLFLAVAVFCAACWVAPAAMAGSFKPDQAKPDQCKPDQAKPDQCKVSLCKPDQCKVSLCKPDQCKVSLCKPDQCKVSLCKPDQCKGGVCGQPKARLLRRR
jgi:hypothetical protein